MGYSEGETIKYEYRSAEGEFARLPNLAAELVRQSVDVIVAANPPGIKAACAATSSIPIVFPVGSDPVETGLVASMERPGGNVTGVATMSWRLSHKRLELLREVIPTAIRVGLLRHSANAGLEPQVRASNLAGQALGVEVHVLQIGGTADFEPTIRSAAERGITALATLSDPFVLGYTKEVVELCSRHRLATISPFSEFVVAGGLLSFGPNLNELYRRSARYVDQILKGARPGDLPIEEPAQNEMYVNLRTAITLGLEVPPKLLVQADRVLE